MAYGFGAEKPFQNLSIQHDGKAVAIASLFQHAGITGLYNIGVLPEHRNQGLGGTISHAIAQAAARAGSSFSDFHTQKNSTELLKFSPSKGRVKKHTQNAKIL